MRRRRLLGLGVAIVAAGSWFATSAPTRADTVSASVSKVGWWTQQPGAQPAPDGGFQIANSAGGTLSQAAADIAVGIGSGVSATITLTEGQSVHSDAAGIQICLAATPWKAANPGALADAPQSDCSRTLVMKRDATATTWTADLGGLLAGGHTTSLYFLPAAQAPVPGIAVDPGWQVNITKVTVSASGTTSSDTFTVDPSASSSSSAGSSAGSSSSSFATSSASNTTAFAPGADTTVTPATPSATPPPAASVAAPAAPSPIASRRPAEHKPWARLLIFVPLAALLGAGATLARRQLSPVGV